MTHRGWSASGIAAVICAAAVAIGCSAQDPEATADFVTVEGTHLIRHGQPYHFVGANLWFGGNLAALAEGSDRDRLRRELDLHSYSPSDATTARDRFFAVVLEHLQANAAAGGVFAGSNFWTWGGYGRASNPDEAVWRRGDEYTGDPPQEPQGRNSVFAADASTLAVLERSAGLMREVGRR